MKKLLIICLGLALMAPIEIVASPSTASVLMNSSSFSKIDDLLTQLDNVVDEYVDVSQKAQSDDMEATMNMAKVSVKMSKLVEQLASFKDEMSEEQIVRYTAIIARMSEALK